MIATGFDIESTGLKQEDGHRIVEICMRSYDFDSRSLVDEFTTRINPQRSIQPKAQEVHGISIESLAGCENWNYHAPSVVKVLEETDILIAHNMDFDGPFVGLELLRIGLELPETKSFCTMENGRWATPMGKKPSLKELCFAVGIEYDEVKAHAASYDVEVMMQCFWLALDHGAFKIEPPVANSTEVERQEAA